MFVEPKMSIHQASVPHGEKGIVFPDTRWSVIVRVQGDPGEEAERALEDLCQTYWYPLYCFARSRGLSPHDAEDRTQAFFQRLFENESLANLAAENGRMRSFLLAAMKNFLASKWREEKALKRGGGVRTLSIDQDWAEENLGSEIETASEQAEELFDRSWAFSLLNAVSRRLEEHYEKSGRKELYEAIKPCLEGEGNYEDGAELAARFELSSEGVRSAVFKLRRRFREYVEEEVADTCADENEAREEIVHLCKILAR